MMKHYGVPISTLMLLLTAILMTIGCSKQNPPKPSDPSPPSAKAATPAPTEFNVGGDKLRQGMNQQQVEAAIGKPEVIANSGNNWTYSKRGVFVVFDKSGAIYSIKWFPTFVGVIREGVSIGSTKAEAVAALGNPSREKQYNGEGVFLTFQPPGMRMELTVWKDKIQEFIVYFTK
jgi:outer membrane protein assembly factor BamE (lipoprotein component of BamABCDE complex)